MDLSAIAKFDQSKLRKAEAKGAAPELFEGRDDVERKAKELAERISRKEKVVVFTGAGVSTACKVGNSEGEKYETNPNNDRQIADPGL